MSSQHRAVGIAAVATAAVLWGTVGPIASLYPEGTAFQFATMRNLVGIMLLWTLVALSKNKRRYQRKDLFPLMLGGIGTAGFMPFYTLGFQRTGVAIASVLAIGAAPIFTGIVGRIVLGRVPSRNWFIGTGLAVIGIVGLNWPSQGTSVQVAGAFFALMAALSYALQATGMEMMGNRLSAVQSVAAIWTVGTILQFPIVIGRDFTFLAEPILLIGVIYGGIFTCAISFSMFTWGIARIGAPTAVTVGLMEPITTTALGVFVLNEVLTSIGVVGIVFVLAGLVVVSRQEQQPAEPAT